MTFTKTNTFTNGTTADADEVNANYDEIATELNATTKTGTMWNLFAPIGAVFAWLKSYTNTPALPDGWVECNGQTLSDAGSVYNGQAIPDLNGYTGTQNFLRGGGSADGSTPVASGGTGGQETINLAHTHARGVSGQTGFEQATGYATDSQLSATQGILPTYYGVVWIMRVK